MTTVADHRLTIHRRFPTFDFVLDTDLSPKEVASKLELLLSRQERPKGFILTDPRVDGDVCGATFRLQRREAGFGGSVRPYAEGYTVPTERGSQVFVRVQISGWWWLFSATIVVVVFAMNGAHLDAEAFSLVASLLIVLVFVSAVPVWLEGAQMIRLMRRVI